MPARPPPTVLAVLVLLAAGIALVAGCGDDSPTARPGSRSSPAAEPSTTSSTSPSSSTPPSTPPSAAPASTTSSMPIDGTDWLGTRPLPLRPDGFGEVLPTPAELDPRTRTAPDRLPPPPDDHFRSAVVEVPDSVVGRSTWGPDCPIALDDLRYVTVAFWGFDDRPHTGELLVATEVADDVVAAFARLHELRFPLEEVRVIDRSELALPPTGDGNVTSAFVCRPSTGGSSWSEHAYGRAIDLNPFQNPYVRGDLVLPELASTYVDRTDRRPGMVLPDDAVVEAFAAIGWAWGGSWTSPVDPMHFSLTGR